MNKFKIIVNKLSLLKLKMLSLQSFLWEEAKISSDAQIHIQNELWKIMIFNIPS